MSVVEINDLDTFGQINDISAFQLPPEAWTLAENIRYSGGGVEVMAGWAQIFGTPGVAPHFAIPVKSASQTYWLYVSLTKGYVFDGTTHTNITRTVGGDYTTNTTDEWNGVVFGGTPIFNNGHDVPQYWAQPYSILTKLAALPNWPANMRAKILRNFNSYLVAFNVTDAGSVYPHLVQWSNPAAPGALPTSWAYSSPTTEGGRKDLPDVNSGEIKEALQLQNTMFIYKEKSIWKMNYIGGQFIFQFDTFLENVGILAARCVCLDLSGTKHVVATQDDIIIHNGNTPESILTDRQRKTLFNSMNRDAVTACFMFLNKAKDEVWFCYPEAGQTQATRALVWNAKRGKGAISYVSGISFRNAMQGDIEGASSELWSTGSDVWDTDTGPWSLVSRQQMVLCGTDATKFYQLDSGITRDGTNYSVTLQREDLGVLGKKRSGEWINDFKVLKLVDAVWPKVSGAAIRIRVGFRQTINGTLQWQDYAAYDPATDMWVNAITNEDLPGSGRAVAVEFSSVTSAYWKIDGYSMNVIPLSVY